MASSAQIELWHAEKVATQVTVGQAANGIHYAAWGETRVTDADLERLVGAVPASLLGRAASRAYYFVPLAIADTGETMIAPSTRSILATAPSAIAMRPLARPRPCFFRRAWSKIASGWRSSSLSTWPTTLWRLQACRTAFPRWRGRRPRRRCAAKPARMHGRRAAARRTSRNGAEGDRRARRATASIESAFSDALAIYMLSLAVDFDYHDLREREYPLLAAPALAERLRHVASLFPPNPGYEFQILYRRKG